jgi:redox-sensitive bicupin YhaK (pirin superfamily)
MYEIYRRSQRKRIQSESYTSHSYLWMLAEGEFQPFGSLVHCLETIQRPGTQIQRGPFHETMVVTIPLFGSVRVSTESLDSIQVERSEIARTTPAPAEHLTYEADGEEDVRYLELGFQLPGEVGGSINLRAAIDTGGPRPLLVPLASGQENPDSLGLPIDCDIYMAFLRAGENLIFETGLERTLLLLVLEGIVRFEEHRLLDGDSAHIQRVHQLAVSTPARSKLLLVDIP